MNLNITDDKSSRPQKKTQSVLLLSNIHFQATVDDDTTKPEVLFHKSTKGRIDIFDQWQ